MICRIQHSEPGDYYPDHHRLLITLIGPMGFGYRLNAFGNDSKSLKILFGWLVDHASGGWSRHESAFLIERAEDAFEFILRWQGAEIADPEDD